MPPRSACDGGPAGGYGNVVQAVIVVPSLAATRPDGAPGGLSLLERQLRQLHALGHGPVTLLLSAIAADAIGRDARVATVRVVSAGEEPFVALADGKDDLPERFLFLAADYLVDPRLLRLAAAAAADVLIADEDGTPRPIGQLTRAAVARLGPALPGYTSMLRCDSVDPYAPELRGSVAPFCLRVRSAADRRRGWRVLLDHVQKRGLDVPGAYFDSPFENLLVRALAPTRVTPNHVTLTTLALAVWVGVLFWIGHVEVGLGLALLVGILDGVDGKLARLTLTTSRLGELEHVGDFLYENSWYLALAHFLGASTGRAVFWQAGLVLVASDLLDNLAYGAVSARTGRLIDELSRFDAAFRRVGGRRNVYVWILIIAACARTLPLGFLVASLWAAITAAVHLTRAGLMLSRGAVPQGGDRAPGSRPEDAAETDASLSEPGVGTLAIEK